MHSLQDILPVALTPPCPRHRANRISDRILHLRGGDSSGMRSRSSYRVAIVHHPASLSISGTFRNMRWLDPILFTNLACPHPQKGLLSSKINDTTEQNFEL
jgi:hypothetical protein